MLAKLLKYDLKNLFKKLLPIFLISLAINVIADIMLMIADKVPALDSIAGIILFFAVLLIVLTPFAAFLFSIEDFNNKLVKDEGYLIHTLPVKKSSIVTSKLLASIITVLASIASSFVSLIALTISHIDSYKDVLNEISKLIDLAIAETGITFIILIIASIAIGYILNILNIFASISLGQMHNGNKTVFSIVYFIATYYIMQIISSLITLVPMLFNKDLWTQMEMDMPPMTTMNLFLGISLVLSLVFSIIFYVVSVKILDKKLNLE